MDKRKNDRGFDPKSPVDDPNDLQVGTASRARNRTVMLSPDVAGNIRSRLMETEPAPEPGASRDAGFVSPLNKQESSRDSTRMINRNDFQFVKEQDSTKERNDTARFSTRGMPGFTHLRDEEAIGLTEQEVAPAEEEQEAQVFQAEPVFVKPLVAQAPVVPQHSSAQLVQKGERRKLIGFLVSYQDDQMGEVIELRAGRWMISSKASDQGDCIVLNHHSISPLHAIIRVSDKGAIQVLDQLSEYGTAIIRSETGEEEEIAGAMATVVHGDSIRFGEKFFVVCVVPVEV